MAGTTDSIKLDYFGDTSSSSVDFTKKFSLEVKTPDGTKPIHILIDWDDLLNRPVATYNKLGLVMPVYSNTQSVNIGKIGNITGAASISETGITLQDRSNVSNRFYAVEIDNAGRLYVNVPWKSEDPTGALLLASNDVLEVRTENSKDVLGTTYSGICTKEIGGIKANKVYENATLKEIIDDLLGGEVALTFNGNWSRNPSGYVENGQSVTMNSFTPSITKGTNIPISIEIKRGATSIKTVNADSNGNFSTIYFSDTTTITTSTTYTAILTYRKKDNTTSTVSLPNYITPYWRWYWGATNESITANVVTHLSNSNLGNPNSFTITMDKSYGVIAITNPDYNKLIDENGYDVTAGWTKTTMSITNKYNKTTTYYVWKLSTPTTATKTYHFE